STGGSCWRHPRCSTTWSYTSSATCASQTIRAGSGRSWSGTARTGATSATGCTSTDPSCWPSVPISSEAEAANVGACPPGRSRRRHGTVVHERVPECDVPRLQGVELPVEVLGAALESRRAVHHARERRERLRCPVDVRCAPDQSPDVLDVER